MPKRTIFTELENVWKSTMGQGRPSKKKNETLVPLFINRANASRYKPVDIRDFLFMKAKKYKK